MNRFLVPKEFISHQKITILDKNQVHHIKDVLRLEEDDEVAVFDEQGNEYLCLIKELVDTQIILEIKNKLLPKMNKVKITVACAIPKKAKFDDIIDKLTQIGVDRIIPLVTKRVIVKLDKHKEAGRLKRWIKKALVAGEQSQRNTLPIIDPIMDIKELLPKAKEFELKLIPTLIGERKSLKEALLDVKARNILILIGPEGDFTDEEVDSALKNGFVPVTLGDLVLRVDTAAIAVASILNYVLR